MTDAIDHDPRVVAGPRDVVALCTALTSGVAGLGPLTHGDLTPWNVLRADTGWAVVDWEEARDERLPLHDLAHFVIRGGALLGSRSPQDAVRMLTAPGSPGWMHLAGVGADPVDARRLLAGYLDRTHADVSARERRYRARIRQLIRP